MPKTTISQDVQTLFRVQLAFAKFLSKIKGILRHKITLKEKWSHSDQKS